VIAGFTGSRRGLTIGQVLLLENALISCEATELHHGDCVGADAQVHKIAKGLDLLVCIHPPKNDRYRAFCQGAGAMHPVRSYLRRNRDIVDACDVLIAAPDGPERLRSGTWATIRYARKRGKRVIIVTRTNKLVENS